MAKVISKKEVGQKYMEFMEKLFTELFINYPYDLNYVKKLIEETERERKKGKLIEAENVEKALRKFKKK